MRPACRLRVGGERRAGVGHEPFQLVRQSLAGHVQRQHPPLQPGGGKHERDREPAGSRYAAAIVTPGAEAYVSFPPGTIGGPVTVSSSQPVLASQRVQYYSSFTEVHAA